MKAQPVLRRFYRVRPLPSLVIGLPGALLVLWYAWSAFASLDRYRRRANEDQSLTLETFHIALHDQLAGDVRRMSMPPPPTPPTLPVYELRMSRDAYSTLVQSAEQRSERPYVEGKLEKDGQLLDARVRLRGGRHWHLDHPQKSIKLKLDKGELLDGHRVFNLINDPTSMVIGEQLILDLSRESGVLTPPSHFARVRINGRNLGVYHYETAADESLLRMNRRIPGSIYSGELPRQAENEELWQKVEHWTKGSSRTDAPEVEADFSDLARLLRHVSSGTGREFYDFARHELDLEAFARLDLLDVAFGGDQRDFRDNHKFYFDPYRGRWEPIAWNFRGFRSDPLFNLVDNPMLLRLKMTPGYLTLRDRMLYEFLSNQGSPSEIQKLAVSALTHLAPELSTDPYWDAYRQLPRVDGFHRRMVRPNTLRRAALVVESELTTYRDRHAQLIGELEKNPLYRRVSASTPAPATDSEAAAPIYSTRFDVIVDGRAGVALEALSLSLAAGCSQPSARLRADGHSLALTEHGSELELERELPLYPSVSIVPRRNPNRRRGRVRSELAPVRYPFELETACPVLDVVPSGRHLATDSRVRGRVASQELLGRLPQSRLSPDATPQLVAGEVAPHPWQIERFEPEQVTLGPGDVHVAETRVYGSHQSVTVAPDTRLLMGAGASLVFLGPVRFQGNAHARIAVTPEGREPWGGLAIQGPGTRGSSLRYVTIQGGTKPSWRFVQYSAMLNLHHTRDVSIQGCRFGMNQGASDVLHAAYVDDLRVEDSAFVNVTTDAVDLEYSQAKLRRLEIVNVGDDALDLMGTDVELVDSIVVGADGNAVSSGEQSAARVQNTLIARAKVGVLAKNASSVSLSGSVLFQNRTGVRTYKRTVRYAGDSQVTANVLFVARSERKPVKRDDKKHDRLDQGRVLQDLPQPGTLDHVLFDVLGLSDWDELENWVRSHSQGAVL